MNYEEWLRFRRSDKPVCRHFTFKLGVLLYAIRLLGMEPEIGPRLDHMKEPYSFIATVPEEGQAWLKGRRQVPLGFGWLEPGEPPYGALPMRVNRIAYREFSRNPDLPFERYKEVLGREVFGASSKPEAVDELLMLQAVFATERTWCQPSPLVSTERVRAMKAEGTLTPRKRADYRADLDRLRGIKRQHQEPKSDAEKELHRIAGRVLDRWGEEDRRLLENDR